MVEGPCRRGGKEMGDLKNADNSAEVMPYAPALRDDQQIVH
jgi:hypothetical protein